MNTYKEKLVDLVCRIINEHMEVRFEAMSKPTTRVSADKLNRDEMAQKQIEFSIGQLYVDVCRSVIDSEREVVYKAVNSELEDTISSLFSEEEAKEILDFSQTEAGRKIIRNLDLVRDTVDKSMVHIDNLKKDEWRSEETQNKIRSIIADH